MFQEINTRTNTVKKFYNTGQAQSSWARFGSYLVVSFAYTRNTHKFYNSTAPPKHFPAKITLASDMEEVQKIA